MSVSFFLMSLVNRSIDASTNKKSIDENLGTLYYLQIQIQIQTLMCGKRNAQYYF